MFDACKNIPAKNVVLNVRSLSSRCFFPLFLTSVFYGCSTYQNVTGYFNTYYNSRKLFSEAADEVEKTQSKSIDTLYFAPYNVPAPTQQKFDKVIEKCSRIIQFYPQSSWVDDAILMIGESYVYKGESESGVRKFQELLDNFPTSNLRREARLWQAKAEFFMKKEDEAVKILQELYTDARSEGDNDVLFNLLMIQAQISYVHLDVAQAATLYALASEVSVDGQRRAAASYLLGLTYERSGDPPKAAEAYGRVRNFRPDFALEFQSRLRWARMLALANQQRTALKVLDELFDEPLRSDEKSLVDLEIANTDWAMGDTASAFALYRMIDTTYRHSDAAAKGYFQRGKIYEKKYLDLRQARDFYTMARDEFPASEITPQAQQRALTLTNYFRCTDALHQYDSLLYATLHPDTSKKSVDSLSSRADSMSRNSKDVAQRADSLKASIDSTNAHDRIQALKDEAVLQHRDSLMQARLSSRDEDAIMRGKLRGAPRGMRPDEPMLYDSLSRPGFKSFPNAFRKSDTLSTANAGRDSSKLRQMRAMPVIPLSADSIRSILAINEFELAGLFFLELHLTDSALVHFGRLVDSFPSSQLIARSLYAMAEIHRTKNDSVAVDSLYSIILEHYGTSEYAVQIRKLRGLKVNETLADSAAVQYHEAERMIQVHFRDAAIRALIDLSKQFPASPLAPKALYMVGWIYENLLLKNDSAASAYERLVKAYPASVYAANVKAKLAVRANPKSLEQYVKIVEIPVLQSTTRTRPGRDTRMEKDNEEELRKSRSRDMERDLEDNLDDNTDDEIDTPDEPDDNTDSGDDNNNN